MGSIVISAFLSRLVAFSRYLPFIKAEPDLGFNGKSSRRQQDPKFHSTVKGGGR